METKVYGAYHKDDEIRLRSSSGGVFAGLANNIIDNDGIVFGAKLSKNPRGFECNHIKCDKKEDIEALQGSKYIPSKLQNTYLDVKEYLEKGRKILFCGTPCQVAGLLAFLDKPYENLYTVDFICHGIPTPKLLKKVIEEEKDFEKIQNVRFRDKTLGWENYSFLLEFSNGERNTCLGKNSKFMKMYLSDMYLRPSCYNCQFKGVERESDITLGDFWGVTQWKEIEKNELIKGISIVIIHSENGKQLLNMCEEQLIFWESDTSVFDKANVYINNSAERAFDIGLFQYWFSRKHCEDIIRIYTKTNKIRELIKKIRRKLEWFNKR